MWYSEYEAKYSKIFPFYDKLTQKEKEFLISNTKTVSYKKDETVHGTENECTGAIVVISGCLRAYMISEQGREITLYRLYEGDICMLSASCVFDAITFEVGVDAETDSVCYIISGNAFALLAEKNLLVKNFALETAVSRFSDVMWVMQQILFMSLDKRLAIFLWDEAVKSGESVIRLTHEQIARHTGSAREAISRMLKYFSSEGIVKVLRGGIEILDKEKLKSLIYS